MSITRSVASVVNTSTAPPAPEGTITAFERTVPVGSFNEATRGRVCPSGQAVRNPKVEPFGTAAKFKEYAWALTGSPHALPWIGKERVLWAAKLGPPKKPVGLRVSATRQGGSG